MLRKNTPVGLTRNENAAEHGWHTTLAAMLFAEGTPVAIDVPTVLRMLLIHDIVEVDAGDVIVTSTRSARGERGRRTRGSGRGCSACCRTRSEAEASLGDFRGGRDTRSAVCQRPTGSCRPAESRAAGRQGRHGISRAQVLASRGIAAVSGPVARPRVPPAERNVLGRGGQRCLNGFEAARRSAVRTLGPPERASRCFCGLCRKQSGSAFGACVRAWRPVSFVAGASRARLRVFPWRHADVCSRCGAPLQ